MDRVLSAVAPTGIARSARLLGYPEQCPRCHHKLVPRLLGTSARSLDLHSDVEEMFQCTNDACGGLFIAVYPFHADHPSPPSYKFARSIPLEARAPDVSDIATTLSPNFFETYSQALIAEALGLGQLSGIGLRKALEFLVKDFAASEYPDKVDDIRRKPLAKCISEYIADTNTKEMAKRAAWLGNDETHYVRRWESQDISDLNILLRLTINGIENVPAFSTDRGYHLTYFGRARHAARLRAPARRSTSRGVRRARTRGM